MKFSMLYPDAAINERLTDYGFVEDLDLSYITGRFKDQTDIIKYFTKNEAELNYRLDILTDFMNVPDLVPLFDESLINIEEIEELQSEKIYYDDDLAKYLYSITQLELYTKCIDKLYGGLCKYAGIRSEALTRMIKILKDIAESSDYKIMTEELARVTQKIRNIKSLTIGINLDANLRMYEAGVLSINTELFRSGDIIDRILRVDTKNDGFLCISPLSPFKRDKMPKSKDGPTKGEPTIEAKALRMAVNNAVESVFRASIKEWKYIVDKYILDKAEFLLHISDDIRFYLFAVKYIKNLTSLGLPVCRPKVADRKENACTLKNMYNPIIAQKLKVQDGNVEKLVFNDIGFDQNGMIYILTGPNSGGKSVFTYGLGLIHALFQLGLYVPAESAELSPADFIYTHFPSGNNETDDKGRLGKECVSIRTMFEHITESSLVLMDEALTSTSSAEGAYIAADMLTGLKIIGCRGVFATHMHDIASKIHDINKNVPTGPKIDNLVACMDSENTGERSYKIIRGMPDGSSYARDIAQKYGVTLDQIKDIIGGRR